MVGCLCVCTESVLWIFESSYERANARTLSAATHAPLSHTLTLPLCLCVNCSLPQSVAGSVDCCVVGVRLLLLLLLGQHLGSCVCVCECSKRQEEDEKKERQKQSSSRDSNSVALAFYLALSCFALVQLAWLL